MGDLLHSHHAPPHTKFLTVPRRVGRIEAFLLGVLCTIALSVVGGLAALLNLPGL
jgi:hypothetical protein